MNNLFAQSAGFAVLERDNDVQTAVMRLQRGEASGPLGNEHADSAQVLCVVSGSVDARIGDREFMMNAGDSAIVGKGVEHRFVGASDEPAITFNVYCPPAY
ncbi:MAG: cupin domain-containing protein [Candidatus Eremiobacteraeota bacterium]|nr:cupin domain-containing protein [Candidatus Eremiobacteraeota bacterium]